jgi:hypothetical protein
LTTSLEGFIVVVVVPISTIAGRRWAQIALAVLAASVVAVTPWVLGWWYSWIPQYFVAAFVVGILVLFRLPSQPALARKVVGANRVGPGLPRGARRGPVRTVARAFYFVFQVGHALLPVALFFVVIWFFASAGDPWWKQLLYGAVSAELLTYIAHAEHDDAQAAIDALGNVADNLKRFIFVLIALLVGAVLGFELLRWLHPGTIKTFERYGGIPTYLAVIAVLAVALGAIVRLAAFAVSRVRAVCVLALIGVLVFLVVDAGFLPGSSWTEQIPWWALATLAGLAVVVPCWAEWRGGVPELPHRPGATGTPKRSRLARAWRNRRAIGFQMIILASFVFVIAVASASLYATDPSNAFDRWGADKHGTPTIPQANFENDASLAHAFAPVLEFTADEQWVLGNPSRYLKQHELVNPKSFTLISHDTSDAAKKCTANTCAVSCAATKSEIADAANGKTDPCASPHTASAGKHVQGVVYAHVLRRTRPADLEAFDSANPFGRKLTALVEYWLFYPYDLSASPTFAGVIEQRHQADWEVVIVGFSNTQPLFVGYSQHCGGQWLPWQKINVVRQVDPNWPYFKQAGNGNFHPLIAVAEGSHANYPQAWSGRAPPWGSCGAHVSRETSDALSYAWNLRDKTGDTTAITPANIVIAKRGNPATSLPAHWGPTDSLRLVNFRKPDRHLQKTGVGPSSPAAHPIWSNPVNEIFCNPEWRPKNQCKDPPPKSGGTMPHLGAAQLIGASAFGAILGWCLCWIFFREKGTTLKDLALIVATLGGAALTKLFPDRLFGYYCVGAGAGFFAAFIVVSLAARKNNKFIDSLLGS